MPGTQTKLMQSIHRVQGNLKSSLHLGTLTVCTTQPVLKQRHSSKPMAETRHRLCQKACLKSVWIGGEGAAPTTFLTTFLGSTTGHAFVTGGMLFFTMSKTLAGVVNFSMRGLGGGGHRPLFLKRDFAALCVFLQKRVLVWVFLYSGFVKFASCGRKFSF